MVDSAYIMMRLSISMRFLQAAWDAFCGHSSVGRGFTHDWSLSCVRLLLLCALVASKCLDRFAVVLSLSLSLFDGSLRKMNSGFPGTCLLSSIGDSCAPPPLPGLPAGQVRPATLCVAMGVCSQPRASGEHLPHPRSPPTLFCSVLLCSVPFVLVHDG
eukprot:RCo028879